MVEQARAMQAEATELAARAKAATDEAALEPERPAVENLEKELTDFEEGLEVPEIPSRTAELERGVDDLLKRAERNLPEELPERWDIIGRIRLLKGQIAELRELVDAGLADDSVVREIDRLSGELRDLDSEVTAREPAAPGTDPWQQRLDRARWDPHGYKHMQARSEAQAREMTTPTDENPDPASQYLPEVNNQALELEALRNGEVIRGDPTDPSSGVHVKYDAGRVIGYDGGEPVTTMRAELSGNTYHGHPRKF
jgi:soluble cytochrome b562